MVLLHVPEHGVYSTSIAYGTVGASSLRDQILRRERGQGNTNFPCLADHEQDWQPYPVDPYPAVLDYGGCEVRLKSMF